MGLVIEGVLVNRNVDGRKVSLFLGASTLLFPGGDYRLLDLDVISPQLACRQSKEQRNGR